MSTITIDTSVSLTPDQVDEICNYFNITVHLTGETCFRDTAPEEELDKWFIAYLSDESRFDVDAYSEDFKGSYSSELEAKVAAIRGFNLLDILIAQGMAKTPFALAFDTDETYF